MQNIAIAEAHDRFVDSGWHEVVVVHPSERFAEWDYEPRAKAKGGAIYIEVAADGHVTVYKGLTPRGKAGPRASTSASESDPDALAETPERPELSAPLANYIDIVRHSAVRLAVANAPKVALRLVLALMIGGGKHWTVQDEPQTPHNEAIATWRDILPTQGAYVEVRRDAAARLGLDDDRLIAPDHDGARTAAVFERLIDLPDKDVLVLLAVAMAETLAMGTTLIDALGARLAVDIGEHWHPDDLFFDLARDREAVGGMLTEVIGESAAGSYLTEAGTKKKSIIRKTLSGDGRTKVEGWLPRYMQFPQVSYTARPISAQRRKHA